MTKNLQIVDDLYRSLGPELRHAVNDDEAHIEIHQNRVVGCHLVPGLQVDAKELNDGVEAKILLEKNTRLVKPVRICFGVLPENGRQNVVLDIALQENTAGQFRAYCTFPNARKVEHRMNAVINIEPGADYSYTEHHVHGPHGGVLVMPKAHVVIGNGARFRTEFKLLQGRVGEMDIDYELDCYANAVFEMLAAVNGKANDRITIHESGRLLGEYSRGALTTHIAVRNQASAEVYNTLIAEAPYARGHVDCKEIIQDQGKAKAVPIVEVRHPKAHVTHEAAIGSVDSKQLETLMSRGLNEEEAIDLIIAGMLS